MSARERECGELPPPICPCLTARSGRDFLFLRSALASRRPVVFPLQAAFPLCPKLCLTLCLPLSPPLRIARPSPIFYLRSPKTATSTSPTANDSPNPTG